MGKLQNAKNWRQKRCNLAESQNSLSWETLQLIFEGRRLIQGNAVVICIERKVSSAVVTLLIDVGYPVFRADCVCYGIQLAN
jgi:hypothetical protein